MIWVAWNICGFCVRWSTKLLSDIVFDGRVETYHRDVEPSNVNTDDQNWTTPFRRAMPDLAGPNL